MTRCLIFLNVAAVCLAGCGSPPQARRFVPASTVVRVEPLPTTRREFQQAEQQGYLIAATGLGPAVNFWDRPVQMCNGEALHVLGVDADSGEVLVRRLDDHTLARLTLAGLEVRATTYGR